MPETASYTHAGSTDETAGSGDGAQEKAREVADQARGRVSQEVDRRSTVAGEQVSSQASDARTVADELRKQGKDAPARYVDQAADRAERLGGYLQESDGDRILHDVEDFARRNPWAVAAGGLVLGFAASRMLKASSGERYRSGLSTETGVTVGGDNGAGHGTRPSQFEPHV